MLRPAVPPLRAAASPASLLVAFAISSISLAQPPDPFPADLPPEIELGACSAVAVDRRGQIYLFHRGPRPIVCLSAAGAFQRAWGDGDIQTAHGMRIDSQDHLWVTDIGSHRVLKFDLEGKLLLALGTGKPGDGEDQFNKPTDVAFGLRGEFYVADGYNNSRVVKFSPSGRRITQWGIRGAGPGQFHLPHAILVDGQGRVLVGDRENNRIQVFDADGKWLATWPGFAPYGLALDRDGRLFVADGRAHQILRLRPDGTVAQRWGARGSGPKQFRLPHMIAFDRMGNLLVAEVEGKRLQRIAGEELRQAD